MPDRSQTDNNKDQPMDDNNNDGGMFGQASMMGNGYSGYMWCGINHEYI